MTQEKVQDQAGDQSANLDGAPADTQDAQDQPPDTVPKADHDRVVQQLKSLEGRVNARESQNERFDRIEADNTSIRESIQKIGAAISGDNLDALDGDLSSIDQKRIVALTQTKSTAEMTSLKQQFDSTVLREDGSLVLDLKGASELQEARVEHDRALELLGQTDPELRASAKDVMNNAIKMAKDVVHSKVLADMESRYSTERDKWNEDNAIGDMGTGQGSSGGVSEDYKSIRDAYIADPNDSAVQTKYFAARAKRGL